VSELVARGLLRAEDRLRAEGMTGGRAFEALVDALRARLGDDVEPLPAARDAVADLPLGPGVDLLGLAYERFFSDLFKGKRGQYFTPRPLVELLLDVAGVGPGDDVLDPTCGSGGFLVVAARRGARVRGIERDPLLARLAALNLRLAAPPVAAGVPPAIQQADFFAAEPDPADVVVANPPFSVAIEDPAVLRRYTLAEGRDRAVSDALFCEALARWVRPGGRAAIVLPFSIVSNAASEPLRDALDAGFAREGVCALPEGVFRPFGGAAGRAVLLWLRRRPCAAIPARWADLADPGWDVRSQRFKATSTAGIEALARGDGWRALDGWTPPGAASDGLPLADLAIPRDERTSAREAEARYRVVDLADVDKATGEVIGVREEPGAALIGPKSVLKQGDVLVSRLRPELNTVAIAPADAFGSSEWIALEPRKLPHWLLLALRTPAWRASLPLTGGQTRPRTTAEAVATSRVPWPGEEVASRADALAAQLHAQRASLRDRLLRLQEAVDRFGAGEIGAEELDAIVRALS
jgi:methylase of polypeptide subunit release factors